MYVWSITPFNRFDIRIRRIRKKIHDISSRIPSSYRPEGSRIPLRLKDKPQTTVPEYEAINKRVIRYSRLLKDCRINTFPHDYIDAYFSTKEKALEFAENFDHECCYYKWLKVQRHWLIDTKSEGKITDFEKIGYTMVDKTDVWFRLKCICDAENHYEECPWDKKCFEYVVEDPPDYLKVKF